MSPEVLFPELQEASTPQLASRQADGPRSLAIGRLEFTIDTPDVLEIRHPRRGHMSPRNWRNTGWSQPTFKGPG
jgi:hypothetical protein